MTTGQILLVLGALMLLSLINVAVKSTLVGNTETMLDAEAALNAVSIAQSMMDEIMSRSYDEASVSATVDSATSFTLPYFLGPTASEDGKVPLPDTSYRSASYYNDVDDYNNYERTVISPRMGLFSVVDTVYYVSESNPNLTSSVQTYFKKIVVTVSHKSMTSPIQLSDIVVYRKD